MPEEIRTDGRLVAGQYRIVRELGRGGMGTVWLAEDTAIGRKVAIKELRPYRGSTDEDRQDHLRRALHEARNAARISHPNAVTLHHVIPATADDEAVYLIMELVDGPTLSDLVQRQGPLPAPLVARFASQLLGVLEEAHGLDVVHRDIKPANVIIARNDQAKLADFGIAHVLGETRLTRGGTSGTLPYMAPELFQAQPIAAADDLWALGATLFYAADGRVPFDRDTDAATMHAILYEDIPAPRCDPVLATTITGLLRRDPRQRFTIQAARDSLRSMPSSGPSSQWPQQQERAVPVSRPAPAISNEPAVPEWSDSATGIRAPTSESPAPACPETPSVPATPVAPLSEQQKQQLGWAYDARTGKWTGTPTQIAKPDTAEKPAQPERSRFFPFRSRKAALVSGVVAVVVVAGGVTGGVLLTSGASALSLGSTLKTPGGGSAASVSFNAAGSMLAAADNTSSTGANKAPEWNAASRSQATVFSYIGASDDLAFSPSGQLLAIAGADLYVYNAASHANTAYQFDTIPRGVAFSPDSKTLAVGGQLRTGAKPVVRLLNTSSGRWAATLPGLPGNARVGTVAFSPNGTTLAASDSASGSVYLWNVAGKSLTATVKPGSVAGPIAFSPDGRSLAVATDSGQVKVWNIAESKWSSTMSGPGSGGVKAIAYSHDGRSLAIADGNGTVGLLSASGSLTARASDPGVESVAFSPDGKTLATGTTTGEVQMWMVPGR